MFLKVVRSINVEQSVLNIFRGACSVGYPPSPVYDNVRHSVASNSVFNNFKKEGTVGTVGTVEDKKIGTKQTTVEDKKIGEHKKQRTIADFFK